MKIRKNDNVLIISGKDRGKKGRVQRTLTKTQRLVVDGINFVKRHQKGQPGVRQGGIIQKEAPLHISRMMIVCIKCDRPTRVMFKHLEDGRKVRLCQKCHEELA